MTHYLPQLQAERPSDARQFDSGAHRVSAARIEYGPVPLDQLGPGEPPPWIWPGYLARGYTTLLTGLWKAGKTTLLGYVLRDLEQGGSLIEKPLGAPALVLSEEAAGHWTRRRDELCLGGGIWFQRPPYLGRPSPQQWTDLVERIEADVRGGPGYRLVVFDTLPRFWPVDNENDATQVLDALARLRPVTDSGAAVLLIHHPKKAEASEARSSRGSGALPGFVDVIVELSRHTPDDPHDCRRVLRAYGRFDDTPAESVVELGDDGFRVIGDRKTVSEQDRTDTIRDLLLPNAPSLPEDLLARWPSSPKPGKRTLTGALNYGFGKGWWRREGRGVKGDPYRFWASDSIPADPHTEGPESNPGEGLEGLP